MVVKNKKAVLCAELVLFVLSVIYTWAIFTSPLLKKIEQTFEIGNYINLMDLLNLIILTSIVICLYESITKHKDIYKYIIPLVLLPILIFELINILSTKHDILLYELVLIFLLINIFIQSISDIKPNIRQYKFLISIISVIILMDIYFYFNEIFYFYELLFQGIIISLSIISFFIIKYQIQRINLLIALIILLNSLMILIYYEETITNISIFSYNLIRLIGLILIFYRLFTLNQHKNKEYISNREKQIKLYADKINRVIEKRTKEIQKMDRKLNEDLEYAIIIQQSLLPKKEENFINVEFISNYFPCEKLSGDFYDIFRIDNKHIGMYLLDVSGHGVSAAMLTMFCKNSIISGEQLIRRYRGLKPHKNLEHFYNLFNSTSFPPETHMVMFFAAYNTETKVLKYSSGGLNCYPIVRRSNGDIYELSDNKGFPISKLGELYTPEYTSSSIILSEKDLVFFYTDGLIDDNKNNVIDYNQLIKLIKENGNAKMIDKILEEKIKDKKNELNDDITYFIMEV